MSRAKGGFTRIKQLLPRCSFRSYPFQSWPVQVGEAYKYSFRSYPFLPQNARSFSIDVEVRRSPPLQRGGKPQAAGSKGKRRLSQQFGLFFLSKQCFSLTTIQLKQCFSASFSQDSASRTGPKCAPSCCLVSLAGPQELACSF